MATIVHVVTDPRSLVDHSTGNKSDRRVGSRVRTKAWSSQEALHFMAEASKSQESLPGGAHDLTWLQTHSCIQRHKTTALGS